MVKIMFLFNVCLSVCHCINCIKSYGLNFGTHIPEYSQGKNSFLNATSNLRTKAVFDPMEHRLSTKIRHAGAHGGIPIRATCYFLQSVFV